MTSRQDASRIPTSEAMEAADNDRPPSGRHEIEMILTRQLAGYLALPMVLVDTTHDVVFYNEPAEVMLGRRFDEGGPVPWTGWGKAWEFCDEDGNAIDAAEMPITVALEQRQLVHRRLWLHGMDGVRRHMAETAIPLIGNAGRFLGAVAFFTEIES